MLSFGCIMVLKTEIYFILLHDKLVRKILLFTMAISLKVCTQHLEKYADNILAANDLYLIPLSWTVRNLILNVQFLGAYGGLP